MATGKQLSFQYGEVAPIQRFNANDVAYSNALQSLVNMFVRRTGGVSNRPGTIYSKEMLSEFNDLLEGGDGSILAEGEATPIRTFTVRTVTEGDVDLTFARVPGTDPIQVNLYISTWKDQIARTFYISDAYDMEKIDVSYSNGYFVITPSMHDGFSDSPVVFLVREDSLPTWNSTDQGFTPVKSLDDINVFFDTVASPIYDGYILESNWPEPPPYLGAVTYKVTAENYERAERVVLTRGTQSVDPDGKFVNALTPGDVYFPQKETGLINVFRLDFGAGGVGPGIKRFNVYRASGLGGTSAFSLVGRVKPSPGAQYAYFEDIGIDGDASVGPPIDLSLVGLTDLYSYAPVGITCAVSYQEKLFLGSKGYVDPATVSSAPKGVKAGDCIVSKLGALQFTRPVVTRNTEAFQFSVPVKDPSPIVAGLSDKRLILMTEESTYLIAGGGEQGIVTPTEVNPLRISDEGCSTRVRPKMAGNFGVFINNSHTKLMTIMFSDKGVQAVEASKYASHFISPDICAMEVIRTSQGDDIIYLLNRDGSMVSVTMNENGTAGFSKIELGSGRVVSMFKTKSSRKFDERYHRAMSEYETLGLYVVHKNLLTLEYLSERTDTEISPGIYADLSMSFGSRLAYSGYKGYVHQLVGANWWYPPVPGAPVYANLTTATNWEPGTAITLSMSEPLSTRSADHIVINHFYEDSDGTKREIILKPDWTTEDNSSGYTVTVYCDYEIPEPIRDIAASQLSTAEKNRRSSRWLPASKKWDGAFFQDYILYLMAEPYSEFDYSSGAPSYSDGEVELSVSGDNKIMASPLNPYFYDQKVKLVRDAGGITLDDFPQYVSWGYIGLPYRARMESLAIEPPGDRTLTDSHKIVNSVGVALHNTGQGFVGTVSATVEKMSKLVPRNETDLSLSDKLFSDYTAPTIESRWTREGRIAIEAVDPAPINILSIYPQGLSGE